MGISIRSRPWPSTPQPTTRSARDGRISSRTPGGIPLDELTLDDAGVDADELRATPETLRLQAEVAGGVRPRRSSPANLRRAAELAPLPDETILEIYTALRPRRSTAAELEAWAARLEAAGRAADRRVRARGRRGLRRSGACLPPDERSRAVRRARASASSAARC